MAVATPVGAAAQGSPGQVVRHVKISDTAGGAFRPVLGPGDQFGRGVAAVGDVNGDGVIDLAVGAHKDDDGGTAGKDSNLGAVWILFLGIDGRPVGRQKISAARGNFHGGLDQGDEFGRAVGAMGDFDGDGVPDIIVGASCDDDGGPDRGAAYLIFLNGDGTAKAHRKISDTQGGFQGGLDDGDEFGRGFALLGDLDGNGAADVAVAATLDDDGGNQKGAFYVLFLNPDGTANSHRKVSATQGNFQGGLAPSDSFAMSLANIGDLDDDGAADLAVGSIGNDTGGVQTGVTWILFMRNDGTVKDFDKVSAFRGLAGQLEERDQFGFGCAGIGDLDGDGVEDVVVGAALDDDEGQNRGAVYVLFMRPDGTVKSFQKISATQGSLEDPLGNEDWFGCSVTHLGDLDQDGFGDVAVGVRFDDDGGQNQGAVFVLFLGGTSADPNADFAGSPGTGPSPLTVRFTDSSSGAVTSWSWDFGDGGASTAQNPTHTYQDHGTYTVSLTAGNSLGSDSETKAGYVTAVHQGPATTVSVLDIAVRRLDLSRGFKQGIATVTLHDDDGNPVPGATVSARFTGKTTDPGLSGATGASGQVVFRSSTSKGGSGEWCLEVTNVSHPTLAYAPARNRVTLSCESGDRVWGPWTREGPSLTAEGTSP